MSRSSTPVLAASALAPSLLLLMLMPRLADAAEIPAANGSCDVKSCALLEASLLEEYVSGLNASELPLSEVGNATLPPFGALPTDWSRLLLLQNSQPEGTPLRESLLRLSRLILAAYFDSQERHDWTDQLVTGDHGRGGDVAAGAASEAESEDQQANNATSGSTGQKGSTRINASSIDVAAYNNGGSQPSGGNFSGNEDDSTTSHYSAALPTAAAGGANFNQTFSSAADNEAGGSNSNETSPRGPGPFFLGDDGSASNEVLHERSREELLRRLKDDSSSSSASDEALSFEFNSTKSVEDFFASPEERPDLVAEFFATEATATETAAPGFTSSSVEDVFASSEENATLTKSVEDFFAASGEFDGTVEDFFRTSEPATQRPPPVPGTPSSPEIAGDSSTADGMSAEPRKNEDNPGATTTMARLISGGLRGEIAGEEDRSRSDAAMPAMPAGPLADENRASDRPDDLFSESTTTTRRRPGDDWNSTGSSEPASDGENSSVTVAAVRLRRSTPQYFRHESSPAAAATEQPVPPASSDDARDSREESATASSRNRSQRRVRRNKRRTRKRAGAEPDVEGQYPSFDAREPGQALLAEERSAENSGRSLQ